MLEQRAVAFLAALQPGAGGDDLPGLLGDASPHLGCATGRTQPQHLRHRHQHDADRTDRPARPLTAGLDVGTGRFGGNLPVATAQCLRCPPFQPAAADARAFIAIQRVFGRTDVDDPECQAVGGQYRPFAGNRLRHLHDGQRVADGLARRAHAAHRICRQQAIDRHPCHIQHQRRGQRPFALAAGSFECRRRSRQGEQVQAEPATPALSRQQVADRHVAGAVRRDDQTGTGIDRAQAEAVLIIDRRHAVLEGGPAAVVERPSEHQRADVRIGLEQVGAEPVEMGQRNPGIEFQRSGQRPQAILEGSHAGIELAAQRLAMLGDALALSLTLPVHAGCKGQRRQRQQDAAGQRGAAQASDAVGAVTCKIQNQQRRDEKDSEHVADVPVPPFEAGLARRQRAAERKYRDPPTGRHQAADQAPGQQQPEGVALLFQRAPALAQRSRHQPRRHGSLESAAASQRERAQHRFPCRPVMSRSSHQVHRQGAQPDRRHGPRRTVLQDEPERQPGSREQRACKTLWQRHHEAQQAGDEVAGGHAEKRPRRPFRADCRLCCRGHFELHLRGFAVSP